MIKGRQLLNKYIIHIIIIWAIPILLGGMQLWFCGFVTSFFWNIFMWLQLSSFVKMNPLRNSQRKDKSINIKYITSIKDLLIL